MLNLTAHVRKHLVDGVNLVVTRIPVRHGKHLLVGFLLIHQVEHADGPYFDQAPGETGLLNQDNHIHRIAIIGKRPRNETIVARIVHGRVQRPIQPEDAKIPVVFVFIGRILRDLDNHAHNFRAVRSGIEVVEEGSHWLRVTWSVISAPLLTAFCRDLLEAANVPSRKADLIATTLVGANLRGIDSHGVQLLPFYIDQTCSGDMNPLADGRVVSEDGACLLYDGENGPGQPIAETCCGHGIRIAKEHGMSMVVARESNHFGAAYYWARKYSAEGLIGLVFCNASPMVPPWQGRQPRFGTNPICMSVPGGDEQPWLLDMATTTVAAGKIYKAMINGQASIPPGWAFDSEGVPTTSVDSALNGGLVAPLGGYKGSGLAFMVEILCAVLSGGAMSTELGGIRIRGRAMRVSQTFIGIDIARFMPIDTFRARMDHLIRTVKSTLPAKGYDEVLVAGEPELRTEAERLRNGIPIEAGTWKSLTDTAARFGVAVPVGE